MRSSHPVFARSPARRRSRSAPSAGPLAFEGRAAPPTHDRGPGGSGPFSGPAGPADPGLLLRRARRLGHRPGGYLLGSPAAADTLQRKLGLELELPVPIDKAGKLTEDDHEILAGKKQNSKRLKEIRKSADAGYGEFHNPSGSGWALHADHTKRVLPDEPKGFPIRVLGKSILEVVFDPAVETKQELKKTLAEINELLQAINRLTDGLTNRSPWNDGIYIGPIKGKTKPPQLGFDASIHVNLGVDIRQFHPFLGWYRTSAYKPKKKHKSKAIKKAIEAAGPITKEFVAGSGIKPDDAQGFHGLLGLTTVYLLYLKAGDNESKLSSTVKNFTAILLKTPFLQVLEYGLTPVEQQLLLKEWKRFKKLILRYARGSGAKETDLFIKRTKRDLTTYKEPSLDVSTLFEEPDVPLVAKTIDATAVGPVRSPSDKVTGGKRRKAPVFEFRSLPGYYKPEQWEKVGEDFLRKADELNAVKDYREPKPMGKQKPSKKIQVEKGNEDRSRRIESLSLPQVPIRQHPSLVAVGKEQDVSQRNQFWSINQRVTWNEATWTVLERLGVNKYRLKRVA